MASLLLRRPLLLPFTLTTSLCATTLVAVPLILRRPMLMDTFPTTQQARGYSSSKNNTPIVKNGRWNQEAVRQVSMGSISGLVGGVLVSFFSKPLALLIGLLVIAAQMLESRGIHIIPYNRIQGYFKNVDPKSAVQSNPALKLSFGITFALAAFAKF